MLVLLRRYLAVVFLLVALAVAFAGFRTHNQVTHVAAKPEPVARPDRRVTGIWTPPAGLTQVKIWPGAAPDQVRVSERPESVLTRWTPEAIHGDTSQAVFDVSHPTMTVFPPQGTNTGAAVVVFPGGGFSAVVITSEGTEICKWLAGQGITCILSKYRVPETGHHWDKSCNCGVVPAAPNALQDAQRTIRLVRSQAAELNVDPHKIGAMGFSAGGYLVAQVSNIMEPAYRPVDEADRISSRPDFAIVLYPGHICRRRRTLDPELKIEKSPPRTFLAQAWDDPVDDICNSLLYADALQKAGGLAEVHLFAQGGHGFTLRKDAHMSAQWPGLLQSWLRSIGILG
ncbi:alpha/beta hydrolase [Sphingomonas sp. DG1-23]|uniref:alpha/beta hydrolase n=1 Tax=Sphingomonas sp. DG1-23 TaxID=3068316 RepID=UPI00273D1DA2|nr:alpha/beta hydrolase [Sphingomonas sp. DG1-23]MDP5278775.1 alpha/beta hydrolase [Sphingomonas sp. DG1-23]